MVSLYKVVIKAIKVEVGIMSHLSLIINFSGENHWNKDKFLVLHN